MGTLIDRVHRKLTDADIACIADTYHAWQGRGIGFKPVHSKSVAPDRQDTYPTYFDIPSFCKSTTQSEIAEHGNVLTPRRYVGAEEVEDDGEPFEAKMKRLADELSEQFCDSSKLETAIKDNMKALGFILLSEQPLKCIAGSAFV